MTCDTFRRAKWLLGRYGSPTRIPGRKRIGSGAFSTAYRVGNMVLKRSMTAEDLYHDNVDGYASRHLTPRTRRAFKKTKIRPIPTQQHRGYDIQPFASPAGLETRHLDHDDLDLKLNNMGYYRGKLVAFDW